MRAATLVGGAGRRTVSRTLLASTLRAPAGALVAAAVALAASAIAVPAAAQEGPLTSPHRAEADVARSRGSPHSGPEGRSPPAKSIAIYVGRGLTEDGSVLLGGFGHEPSGHWYEVTPGRTFPEGTTVEVGITGEARIPGRRFRIPQVRETFRFITTNYSEFAGFPPPLTNGGLNEHRVAARDVWSPSRRELVEMTPRPQTGLSYSDLSRIAMERATSAREAAEIVGALIDEHGYATYGGNSHLFADPREGWVVLNFAGGQGLWAAERLGPDEVRVSYPGYIGEFPVDFGSDADFMGSEKIVSFAVERGWWDPESGEPFDLHRIYGRPFPSAPGEDDPHDLHRYPPRLEEEIAALAPVGVTAMMALVRDPRWSNDGSGYGQVAHLREGVRPELGVLWMSITGAVASPFVPVRLGVRDLPPEYKQHRYMTKASDRAFLDSGFAPLEGTRSAFRVHKRLLYHTCAHPETFLGPVTADLEAFEEGLVDEQSDLEARAEALFAAGAADSARALLTGYVEARLLDALDLGEALVRRVEDESRERFGIPMPGPAVPEGASWRPESGAMTLREGGTYHRCWVAGTEGYPRAHGSRASLASGAAAAALGPGARPGVPGGGRGVAPGGEARSWWTIALGLALGGALAGAGAGWLAGRRSRSR